eukprot:CAMPEP_0116843004 /NCGR_PEP_ID=MMETSP0418-20121206/11841_1 /TAXON_ID=1158023 /ORGANISM="Astrosyne radiata, Strain 13vi08-1A" /LENGTH=220 /DNA_ID=CAMNT_0004473697 /DNA_START=265 /DNA_END=927 /DNA_ORIENTATION=-
MTGNCLGWCAYGYYTHDPFVLAGNLPPLVVSIWLNIGAAKLQFLEQWKNKQQQRQDEQQQEMLVVVLGPQETNLLRMLLFWCLLLVYVGWLWPIASPAHIVGIAVNLNLVFFYAAPLEAMRRVIRSGNSAFLHLPTLVMTCTNTTFWAIYGLSKKDLVLSVPNVCGLILGIAQLILRCTYPATHHHAMEDILGGGRGDCPLVPAADSEEESERHEQGLMT